MRAIRKRSSDGEIHLILPATKFYVNAKDAEDLNETEVKKIMKKEAAKPLLISRKY